MKAWLVLLLSITLSSAVTLEWDAPTPPDPTIVGYRLYWGTVSGLPGDFQDAGMSLTTTVSDDTFPFGVTIYFVARSYNAQGVESVSSNEVPWSRPMPTPTPTPTPSPTPQPPENLHLKLTVINGSGDGRYLVGEQVRVEAMRPPRNWAFIRWGGDWVILANPFLAVTTATIPSTDVFIRALYQRGARNN
jgi:hypothetical protein